MTSTSDIDIIDPHPNDWLNADRFGYLYDCVLPLVPLLLEAKLLDQLLISWLQHEIIYEVNPKRDPELEEKALILEWCRQQWGYRLESLYLASKNKLDLVSYRVLTVETSNLAHELYYRLKGNEASFDQLSITYSVGKERFNGGKFTDISLSDFPPLMQSAFASMKVGELHKPVKNGKNFAVVQLLKYSPASLDDQSENRLLLMQLRDWQHGMIKVVRDHLILV